MSEPSVLFACCRSAGSIGFTSASASARFLAAISSCSGHAALNRRNS